MITLVLPLRIVSTPNLREHWGARARRARTHRRAALAVPRHPLPCVVHLTRIAPRELDTDNLVAAFKALRDGIADRLGIADDDERVTWLYAQRKGPYGVEVSIKPWAETCHISSPTGVL